MPPRLIARHLVQRRLIEVYVSATPAELEEGREWYAEAAAICERIADLTGRTALHVAHAVAALSPRQSWGVNCRMAEAMARRTRFHNPGTFQKFARDAWACLQDRTERCSGPKREAFARAILGDEDAVVIDRHILRAIGEERETLKRGAYDAYAGIIRGTAIEETSLSPRDFQAVVWVVQRNRTTRGSEGA